MNTKDTTIDQVNRMTHEELCRHWRFDPVGSWIHGDPVTERAMERYREFGGMTVEISKKIGLDKPGIAWEQPLKKD